MIAFTSIALIGIISILYWRVKGFDSFRIYAVWVISIIILSYFIFSPQGLGDIIK